ncbi:hypothetical protein BaRGS_00022253 [Batillaria attramentaria]|uniref:G-protein coupled receptors family 1 profile domain-containing protein n=1 Tax=Batillaria attramentaria TaxID=370345 RepID=A0ABD0KHD9_9CAEN
MSTSDFSFTTVDPLNTTGNFSYGNDTGAGSGLLPRPNGGIVIQILARFHLIALPTIAILGIISNLLSFCIFVSKTLRRTSCSIYLAARSISDTGFLLSLFITWLGDAVSAPVVHTVVVCQVVIFSSYVFGFLSVWLVVFITLENYIRICHPFSVAKFCTVQKFSLWTTEVKSYKGLQRCGNNLKYIVIIKALLYGDMVITLVLPSLIILFFMVAICISLVRSFKRQSRLKGSKPVASGANGTIPKNAATNGRAGTSGLGDSGNKKSTKRSSSRRNSSPQAKVTRMLFAVSFTFLVLSLPSHCIRLRVAMLLMVKKTSENPNMDEMLQVVFQILYYLSFAVNLVVYLSCGESFRNVFYETYIACLAGKSSSRRRSEISQTCYTAVKMEQQETTTPAPKGGEEETALIT